MFQLVTYCGGCHSNNKNQKRKQSIINHLTHFLNTCSYCQITLLTRPDLSPKERKGKFLDTVKRRPTTRLTFFFLPFHAQKVDLLMHIHMSQLSPSLCLHRYLCFYLQKECVYFCRLCVLVTNCLLNHV